MTRHEQSVNATAWIVNWVCVIMMFIAMVMFGNTLDDLQEKSDKRDTQIRSLMQALAVSPKDVLPHVLKLEQMLLKGCAVQTARQ